MLDESERAKQIFRASELMEAVMARGQTMSVSPSVVRAALLAECIPYFPRMRELARDQFPERAQFILAAVDEFEVAIRALAGLGSGGITEDRRDGAGTCCVCGTVITHFPEYQLVLCGSCDKPFMHAYRKLDSSKGFCTWAI